jgi:hypothetical protein
VAGKRRTAGRGRYERPGDRSLSKEDALGRFLAAVQHLPVWRRAVADFRETVLPLLPPASRRAKNPVAEIIRRNVRAGGGVVELDTVDLLRARRGTAKAGTALEARFVLKSVRSDAARAALHAWAQKYHIDADCILDSLIHVPGAEPEITFLTYSGFQSGATERQREAWRFRFEHPGWNPLSFDIRPRPSEPVGPLWSDAEAAIRKAFNAELRAYHAVVERAVRAAGFSRARVTGQAYFDWLARIQCGEESPPDINRAPGIDPQGEAYPRRDRKTVESGVRDLAAYIGLRLRPGKRGKPRGARDLRPRKRRRRDA